jgi:HlyD family secretion protein
MKAFELKRIAQLYCLLLLVSCNEKTETTQPVFQGITESVYAAGKVKSKDQYDVFASVTGIVEHIHVKEGDIVRKGDPVITLVHESQSLNTENARLTASYQSVKANEEKLDEAKLNIHLAKEKLQNDSVLFARQRRLWDNGIGSRLEIEQRELAYKNSVSAYKTAQLRYRQVRQQLELSELQSGKNLQISSRLTNDYIIRANQDGRVYHIAKQKGEMVGLQAPVAVIGSNDDFILELQVDEYDIGKIKTGQKVLVSMDSYKGKVFEGTVSRIIPILNNQSRSITVEVIFLNLDEALLPNLTTEANILINEKSKTLLIPRSYLIDGTYVLLANGTRKKVVVGLKDYQNAEILSGLSVQDVIKKPAE